MTVLSDKQIKQRSLESADPMIQPFFASSVKEVSGVKVASFGVSSAGYDIRAAEEFMIFTPIKETFWERLKTLLTGKRKVVTPLDFKNMDESLFTKVTGPKVIVPAGGFLLARSVEYVDMPRDVVALCIGKSTIARAGWNCLCTPIEPGWDGYITLEFQNTTDRPNTFYANEGCLQLMFLKLGSDCDVSYKDRGGKYNNQEKRIVLPRV